MTHIALEDVTIDQFREYLNSEFQVLDDPALEFALQLVEVNERAKTPRQEAFSLLFHGPARVFVPQGIHHLEHARLGKIDLFLVPVGQDSRGFQYEAVFNRIVQ